MDYLARNYPFKDDDIEGYLQLKARLPSSVYIIGDDLSASKVEHILTAHHSSVCNGFIIKPSQDGTLTEVKNVLKTIR